MLILHFHCFTEEHVFDNEVIVQYVMQVICTSSLQVQHQQILQQFFTANSWFFGATISIDPEIDFNDHAIDPFPTEVWRWSLTCIGIQIWVNSVAITLVCMCHHVKAAR